MKDEVSAYGWITTALLILAIIILLAFPLAEELGISVKKKVEIVGDTATAIIENIKDEDFFGKKDGYTYYTEENIAILGDKAAVVGYRHPIFVVALFSDDHTEAILSRNSENSDGIMKAEAFMDDTVLTSVVLRNGMRNVSNRAFKGCVNLNSVFLSNGVTYIGVEAFSGTKIYGIDLPKTVTTIEDMAFANCINLESIYIPKSVTYIGPLAFKGCTNLKTIKFESKTRPEGFLETNYPGVNISYNN